jgi:hypothetical protein
LGDETFSDLFVPCHGAGAELGEHMVEFWRRSTRDEVHDRGAGTALLRANFATAGAKSRRFDRDLPEQLLNFAAINHREWAAEHRTQRKSGAA